MVIPYSTKKYHYDCKGRLNSFVMELLEQKEMGDRGVNMLDSNRTVCARRSS